MPKRSALQNAMEEKGWSEHDLADATGIDVGLIRRYLGLYGKPVKIGHINGPKIANALGMTLDALWGRNAA